MYFFAAASVNVVTRGLVFFQREVREATEENAKNFLL
jgi:hypothetical protein